MSSKIEWTDVTWPIVTGCDKVSRGCRGCYAEREWGRFYGKQRIAVPTPESDLIPDGYIRPEHPTGHWTRLRKFTDIQMHPERLSQPLHWKRPRMVFVCAYSDLFHDSVSFEFIDKVFAVMALSPTHTFQILTKRPERMLEYINELYAGKRSVCNAAVEIGGSVVHGIVMTQAIEDGLKNVWLGVSVEDQKAANERIPILLQAQAAIHFLSVEPMLGPIDLSRWIRQIDHCDSCGAENEPQEDDVCPECQAQNALISTWGEEQAERYRTGERYNPDSEAGDADISGTTPRIDWVICGGDANPMHPAWVRTLRDQCQKAGARFVFRSWGDWMPTVHESERDSATHGMPATTAFITPEGKIQNYGGAKDQPMALVGKDISGRLLDGVEHQDLPNGWSTA